MLREQRVAAEREKAAFSVLGRDAAVDREAATEAGRDLFVEDHRGRAGGAFVNDDADRVGADVDDGGSADRLFGGAPEIQPLLTLPAYRMRAWGRSEARGVGKECGSSCRPRWEQYNENTIIE